MTTAATKDEILKALQDAREYSKYLSELGVETADELTPDEAPSPVATAAAAAPARAASPFFQPSAKPVQSLQEATASPLVSAIPKSMSEQSQSSLFGELTAPEPALVPSPETLEGIWRDIGDCTRCGLCEGRTQVVNTHGNAKARLMFVGEAPGADEDAQGKPFVGRAGQLLTKIIEAIGMKREDVLIGNVNRCRPPANRQPTLEEAAICRPFLFREIAAVQPDVIVVMGNTALRNLLEVREGITRVRGQFQDFRGIKVMPTFHPAYLLRDPSKKRETWEDLKKVREYLDSLPKRQIS
jgi:uracil-DNA glycosylase family 4